MGRMLDHAGASSDVVVDRWSALAATGIDVVVASPDHDEVRRQVQLDLPRILLAGGTADNGTYQVARHAFLNGACAGCLWRGDLTDSTPLDGVARALGVGRALLEPYVQSAVPLPREVLELVGDEAVRNSLAEVPGQRLLEHVCGTIRARPSEPAVSAPMLAAAPGVLLAVELIKERLLASAPLREGPNTLTGNILAGPHARWALARGKRPSCECTEELYSEHYRRKWVSR